MRTSTPALPMLAIAILLLAHPAGRRALGGMPEGWRFATPAPQGNTLHAIHAFAADHVLVGGTGGYIGLWDGQAWTPLPTPTQKTIHALHGTSPTDVWAVGGDAYASDPRDRSLVLHWDGSRWTEMAPPLFGGQQSYVLESVLAVAPDDVWATIDIGTAFAHFDGTSWDLVLPPLPLEGSFDAIGMAGGPDHLFFVGTHGQIVHKDGDAWRLEQKTETGSFSMNLLGAFWSDGIGNVFVGGNLGQLYRRNADGTWTDLQTGGGIFSGENILGIWGDSPTDLWLVGNRYHRRFNGQSAGPGVVFDRLRRGSWNAMAPLPDRFLIAGDLGAAYQLRPADGPEALVPLTVGSAADWPVAPRGALPLTGDAILLFGSTLYQTEGWPLLIHAEAGVRRFPSLPPGMRPDTVVRAAAAGAGGRFVVAWDNFVTPERGVHLWDGSQWLGLGGGAAFPPMQAVGLWMAPDGTVHAADPWRVLRWTPASGWEQTLDLGFELTEPQQLTGLWARSASELYVANGEGLLRRFDGTAWHPETIPGGTRVTGFAHDGEGTYLTGTGGRVWRRTGGQWVRLPGIEEREGDDFTHVTRSPAGVFAIQTTPARFVGGGLDRLWKLEPAGARLVIRGLSAPIGGFTATETGHLYAVGGPDFVLTDRPSPAGTSFVHGPVPSDSWNPLGDTRALVRAPNPSTRPATTVAWRSEGIAAGIPEIPGTIPAGEHWVIRREQADPTRPEPPLQIRLGYDARLIPSDLALDRIELLGFENGGWSVVPAVHDEASRTLTTAGALPATVTAWTYRLIPATAEPPRMAIRWEAGRVVVEWPAPAAPGPMWVLETADGLAGGWGPFEGNLESGDGRVRVRLDATGSVRFLRLRQATQSP